MKSTQTRTEPVAVTTEEKPAARISPWFAVVTVAVGTFTLVTTEMLPVGLLTSIAAATGVSDGTVGLLVTAPGIVAALAAPLVTVGTSRLDRRLVLSALLAILVLANLASMVAPTFAVLLTARILVGVSIGGFWAIAGGLGVRLVEPRSVGRATTLIFSGIAVASVAGIPAGTFLGQLVGWRASFGAAALLGALVFLGLLALLPKVPARRTIALRDLFRAIRDPRVLVGVIATFLIVTGHFTGFTFISPVLQQVSGLSVALISSLLLVYGAAGISANFLVGSLVSRRPSRTVLLVSGVLGLAMVLFPLLGIGTVWAIVMVIAWGLGYGGVSVSLQTWMLKSAPHAPEAASSLLVAMFNLSIALGAAVGGFAVDRIATVSVMWIGGALVLLAGVAVWTVRKRPGLT